MGEKMNRTSTWLTLGSIAVMFALGTACASGGGDDSSTTTAGKGSGGSSSTAGGVGSTVLPTSGSSTGGTASTAGSSSGSSSTAGSSTGGTSATSVCTGMTTILPVGLAYIDNFDGGLRTDGWYSFSDTSPPDTPNKPLFETGGPTIFATGKLAHIVATGIKAPAMMGYGAGFGFNLVDPSKEKCIDLSAFEGISFWAKGTAGADNALQFQAVVPETAPTKDGGDCPMIADKPGPDCYLHPSKMLTLTADWKQYTIKFADLKAKKATWKNLILGFNMITPGPAYEVQVDEFSFYVTGMVPAGHVTPPTDGAGGAPM